MIMLKVLTCALACVWLAVISSGARGESNQNNTTGASLVKTEVRYQMMRPGQIVARRKACPIAYVPLGTLEWHDEHLPVGADALQAEGIAIRCAEKGGGLAFPPLYFGENRLEGLVDSNPDFRDDVAKKMELPPENFAADRQPFPAMEQSLNYQKLLLHTLAEIESLGFKVCVLVGGHYPLVDQGRSAVLLFNKRTYTRYNGMVAWACADFLLLAGQYPNAGDHAGPWETSHMLALHPEMVDMFRIPPGGEKRPKVNGAPMDVRDANAAFGWETIEKAVDIIIKEAQDRLSHRGDYTSHGGSLQEGLWKARK